jgi:hypothetical protein
MLKQGLTGISAEAKYAIRKRDMAETLLEQKENAIKEGLKERLRSLDNDLADEVINKAINLDVNSEVEKRFDAIKRNIDSGLSIEDSIGSIHNTPQQTHN